MKPPGWILFAVGVSLLACAKVAPPDGGPVDRTAPRVVDHFPAAEATSVSQTPAIWLDFDEAMDRQRTEEALFISPALSLQTSWDGATRLQIQLPGGLAADRTYVVTLGTDARDQRGNRLQEAYQFAFATGEALDGGLLVGRVVAADGPARGAIVWAYDLDNFTGRFGFDTPAYVTQTGSEGEFRLPRLAVARYRLLAFVDENRDRAYDATERLALTSTDVVVGGTDTTFAGDLRLYASAAPPRLLRLSAVDRQRLLLVFDRSVDLEKTDVSIDGLAVEGIYAAPTQAERIYVQTALQTAGQAYELQVEIGDVSVQVGEAVHGSGRSDERAPQVIRVVPGEVAVEVEELAFTFDEPMAPSLPDFDFWQASDSTLAPDGNWLWQDPLHLVYRLSIPLSVGKNSLRGHWTKLTDLAGQGPGDSLVQVTVEVLAPDQRPRFEGQVALAAAIDAAHVLIIADDGTRRYTLLTDSTLAVSTSQWPPGEYRVYCYADINRNGRHDGGDLEPHMAAEPFGWLGTVTLKVNTTTRADLRLR